MSVVFEDLTRKLMDEVLSWEPVRATQLGWHEYDHVLGDPSLKAHARRTVRCQELIERLRAMPTDSLSPGESLDRDLGVHILRNKGFESGELRLHERGCVGADTIGYSLFFLSYREHPSLDQRIESIVHRIEAMPEFLQACGKALRRPYKLWNEAALEVGLELPALLTSMEDFVCSRTKDGDVPKRARRAVKDAVAAVDAYNERLRKEILPSASEDYAIAPDEYAKYLDAGGYGVTPEQLLEIGEAYVRLCKSAIADLGRLVTPTGDHLAAINALKSDHPVDSEGVLRGYRSAVARAREFTVAKDLCTVPEGEELLVVETPEFMRPLCAFAGQFEPGKFDGNRTGLFVVTPVHDNEGMLREHSHAGIVNTAVHEGYPGHHLQGICSNINPSYVRVLSTSPDFAEGWALYTEQLMVERGFSDSAFGRLAVLNDLLYRAVRLVVEARLVMGTLDVEGGAKMLASECSVDLAAARTEARACAISPTYFCSYLLGKLALHQLRDDVQKAMGSRFTLKFFHDSLLYSGCLPMNFMRRAISIRMKEEYGIELQPASESPHSYAMRMARAGRI